MSQLPKSLRPRVRALQREATTMRSLCTASREQPLLATSREEPMRNEDPAQPKINYGGKKVSAQKMFIHSFQTMWTASRPVVLRMQICDNSDTTLVLRTRCCLVSMTPHQGSSFQFPTLISCSVSISVKWMYQVLYYIMDQ